MLFVYVSLLCCRGVRWSCVCCCIHTRPRSVVLSWEYFYMVSILWCRLFLHLFCYHSCLCEVIIFILWVYAVEIFTLSYVIPWFCFLFFTCCVVLLLLFFMDGVLTQMSIYIHSDTGYVHIYTSALWRSVNKKNIGIKKEGREGDAINAIYSDKVFQRERE